MSVPQAPSNFIITVTNATHATLSWKDNSTTEYGFMIKRNLDNAGWTELVDLDHSITHWDINISAGHSYQFMIYAYKDWEGPSTYVFTDILYTTVPRMLSDVTLTPINGTTATLTWDVASSNLNFYIECKFNGTSYFYRALVSNSGSYSLDISVSGTYQCRVYVYNYFGQSGWVESNVIDATIPHTPTNLNVTQPILSVVLTWTDASNNETGFSIWRKTGSGGTYAEKATVTAGVVTYTDTTVLNGNTYYYKIKATNQVYFDSAFCSEVSRIVTGITPGAPVNLTVTSASAILILLNWEPGTSPDPVTSQRVDYSTDNFATIGGFVTVDPSVFTYNWTTPIVRGTTYSFRIRAANANGIVYSSVVSQYIPLNPLTLPPTNLGAVGNTSGQITLSWTNAINFTDPQKVNIYRALTLNGTYTYIGSTARFLSSAPITSFVDGNGIVADTTYYYKVKAQNDFLEESNYSVYKSVTAPNIQAPTAPTLASQVGNSTATTATITFKDNASNEAGFNIFLISKVDGVWPLWSSVTTPYAVIPTPSGGTGGMVRYTITGLTPGNYYRAKPSAYNAGGDTRYASYVSISTSPADNIPPEPVTGLTAIATDHTHIKLDWVLPTTGDPATDIYIYQETYPGSGSYTQDVTHFDDSTPITYTYRIDEVPGVILRYIVKAHNIHGFSVASNIAEVTVIAPGQVPSVPTSLTGTALSNSIISLVWEQDNSINAATGFILYRNVLGTGSPVEITRFAADIRSYTDTGLAAGTTYKYGIKAFNALGTNPDPKSATVSTLGGDAPVAPSYLAAVAVSDSRIELTWVDESIHEDYFIVERSEGNNTSWGRIVSVLGSRVDEPHTGEPISYSDTGLNAGTTYYYRVMAFTTTTPDLYSQTSDPSNEAYATTFGVTPDPDDPQEPVGTGDYSVLSEPSSIKTLWSILELSDNETTYLAINKVYSCNNKNFSRSGQVYEPRLKGTPEIHQEWTGMVYGVTLPSEGDIVLDNSDGVLDVYYNGASSKWLHAKVTIGLHVNVNGQIYEETIFIGDASEPRITNKELKFKAVGLEKRLTGDFDYTPKFPDYDGVAEKDVNRCVPYLYGNDVHNVPLICGNREWKLAAGMSATVISDDPLSTYYMMDYVCISRTEGNWGLGGSIHPAEPDNLKRTALLIDQEIIFLNANTSWGETILCMRGQAQTKVATHDKDAIVTVLSGDRDYFNLTFTVCAHNYTTNVYQGAQWYFGMKITSESSGTARSDGQVFEDLYDQDVANIYEIADGDYSRGQFYGHLGAYSDGLNSFAPDPTVSNLPAGVDMVLLKCSGKKDLNGNRIVNYGACLYDFLINCCEIPANLIDQSSFTNNSFAGRVALYMDTATFKVDDILESLLVTCLGRIYTNPLTGLLTFKTWTPNLTTTNSIMNHEIYDIESWIDNTHACDAVDFKYDRRGWGQSDPKFKTIHKTNSDVNWDFTCPTARKKDTIESFEKNKTQAILAAKRIKLIRIPGIVYTKITGPLSLWRLGLGMRFNLPEYTGTDKMFDPATCSCFEVSSRTLKFGDEGVSVEIEAHNLNFIAGRWALL